MRLVLAAAALAVALLPAGAQAADTTPCASHTAWAGSETTTQLNNATLSQIPVTVPMTVTHLTVSVSYTQRTGPAVGLSEVLLLVGISDTAPTVDLKQLPATTPDLAFGGQHVATGARWHNENPTLDSGVIAARILKSYSGSASDLIDITPDTYIPAGGVVWLYYGSVSRYMLDPEVQTVITYCT